MSEWWQEFFLSGSYRELEAIPAERTEIQVAFVQNVLGLEAGARVLDVACGIGRHTLPLADGGWTLVGLDYTPAYLQRARSLVHALPARFVRGDMRHLPFVTASFEGLINLFTSFGYFGNDSTDLAVLEEMGRVLRPGGLLLLDIQNRDGLARSFQERAWSPVQNGYLLEERRWDCRAGKIFATWTYIRDGEPPRSFETSVRLYTFAELERMLGMAGLIVEEVWGGWDGSLLSLNSRRLIVKARRAPIG